MELQEKFLHHIWDERHLLPELITVSGKAVKVIYQGQYNNSNGPDFRNVILMLNNETIQGDVEIHKSTSDWTAHHHHEDPAYNSTILHVVYQHHSPLPFTILENGATVEILELQAQIDADIAKLLIKYSGLGNDFADRTCDYFLLSDPAATRNLLLQSGLERFLRKANRFNAELLLKDFDQLLYEGFMEAMGYDKNKYHSLTLAHKFPWNTLKGWQKQGLDEVSLAAIWLNYSGLLPRLANLVEPDFASQISRAFEYQNFTADKGNVSWNLFRIRPANHPVIRIIQASRLVINLLQSGFLTTILTCFQAPNLPQPDDIAHYIKKLFASNNASGAAVKAPGESFILTMVGNIILPVISLYADKTNDAMLKNRIQEIYLDFPPQSENNITQFMHRHMAAAKQKIASSRFATQQGLLYLYYRYCQYNLCELCLNEKRQVLNRL